MSKQWFQDGYYTPEYVQSQQDSINLASGLAIAADTAKNIYGEWQNSQNRKAMQQANQANIDFQHATNLNSLAFAHQERAANSLASRMQEYRSLGLNPLGATEGTQNYAPNLSAPSVSAPQYQILERSTENTRNFLDTLRLANELTNSATTRQKIENDMQVALENLSRQNKEFAHKELVDNYNMSIQAREQNRKELDSETQRKVLDRRQQLAEVAAQLQERVQEFNEKDKNRRYYLDVSRLPWQSILTNYVVRFISDPAAAIKEFKDKLNSLDDEVQGQLSNLVEETTKNLLKFNPLTGPTYFLYQGVQNLGQ